MSFLHQIHARTLKSFAITFAFIHPYLLFSQEKNPIENTKFTPTTNCKTLTDTEEKIHLVSEKLQSLHEDLAFTLKNAEELDKKTRNTNNHDQVKVETLKKTSPSIFDYEKNKQILTENYIKVLDAFRSELNKAQQLVQNLYLANTQLKKLSHQQEEYLVLFLEQHMIISNKNWIYGYISSQLNNKKYNSAGTLQDVYRALLVTCSKNHVLPIRFAIDYTLHNLVRPDAETKEE